MRIIGLTEGKRESGGWVSDTWSPFVVRRCGMMIVRRRIVPTYEGVRVEMCCFSPSPTMREIYVDISLDDISKNAPIYHKRHRDIAPYSIVSDELWRLAQDDPQGLWDSLIRLHIIEDFKIQWI